MIRPSSADGRGPATARGISESFNKALKKRAAARYIKLDPKEMRRVSAEIDRTA